jgi:hypothetical protein
LSSTLDMRILCAAPMQRHPRVGEGRPWGAAHSIGLSSTAEAMAIVGSRGAFVLWTREVSTSAAGADGWRMSHA